MSTSGFAGTVERHALGWLVAANLVGVWLAAVLLWPALAGITGPWGYGRWMPLHLNWQLYGWCSLPIVGALVAWFVRDDRVGRLHVRVALGAWSLALGLGGVSWLTGVTSGKLFLDWHGWARPLLPLAMMVLWSVLALQFWGRRHEFSSGGKWLRGAALALLFVVPNLLFWAAGREVYPAVNPHSGGATGASLLGSTLGVIVIFGLLPVMLRVRSRDGGAAGRWFWAALALSFAVYSRVNHGDASHRAPGQIGALGVLLAWVPLLAVYLGRFEWHPAARPWLRAGMAWWALLVGTGFLTFLPGLSERLKFTNALVSHAHLAMAGLVTSLNLLMLRQLRGGGTRRGFWLWQLGCAVQVAVLMYAGWTEVSSEADWFLRADWTQAIYGVRLAAGLAMLVASITWLKETWA